MPAFPFPVMATDPPFKLISPLPEALAVGNTRNQALHATGRNAHGAPDVQRAIAAAGLAPDAPEPATVRKGAGEPVRGCLVAASRP